MNYQLPPITLTSIHPGVYMIYNTIEKAHVQFRSKDVANDMQHTITPSNLYSNGLIEVIERTKNKLRVLNQGPMAKAESYCWSVC